MLRDGVTDYEISGPNLEFSCGMSGFDFVFYFTKVRCCSVLLFYCQNTSTFDSNLESSNFSDSNKLELDESLEACIIFT